MKEFLKDRPSNERCREISESGFKVIGADQKVPVLRESVIVRISEEGVIENFNFCVCCGKEIPEGTMVCSRCMKD